MSVSIDRHVGRSIRAILKLHGVENEKLAVKLSDYANSHTSRALHVQRAKLHKCDVCGATKNPRMRR